MNPIRVLLADDHELVRAGIRSLLERIPGVEVVGEVSNGREALELVRAELPQLVLMDIAMPELGGLETLPKIIRNFPSVKVVILSAYGTEEYVNCGNYAVAPGQKRSWLRPQWIEFRLYY